MPTAQEPLDVFETFADRIDESAPTTFVRPSGALVARLAAATLAVMVLAAVVFSAVFGWASGTTLFDFQVGVRSTLWQAVFTLGWASLWATLATAVVLAVVATLVIVPWARRQRDARRGPLAPR